jgi:hypothetical protein
MIDTINQECPKVVFCMAGLSMGAFWEKLRKCDAEIFIGDECSAFISSVRILQEGQTDFHPDILYVGSCDSIDMDMYNNRDAAVNLLLIGSFHDKSTEMYNSGRNNIIRVQKQLDITSIFNEAQGILSQYTNWSLKLYDTYIKGKGLDSILSVGYELIGNPIQIIDTSFKLIGGTRDRTVDDPVWDATNKNGFAPYAMVSQLKLERFIEKVHKTREPIFVHPSIHKYTLLMSNIILEDKVLGHIAILEYERPFEESDIQLLKQLNEVVSAELLRNKIFRNSKGLAF